MDSAAALAVQRMIGGSCPGSSVSLTLDADDMLFMLCIRVVPGFNLAVILKDKRLDKGEKEKVFLRERDSHMAAALVDVAISPSSTDQGGGGIGEQPPYFERLELPGGVPYLAFRPSPSPASSAALLAHGLRGSDEDEQKESSAIGGNNKAGGVGGGRTVVAVVGSEHVAGITENWEKFIQG